MRLNPNIADSSSGSDLTLSVEENSAGIRVPSSRRSSVRVTKWIRRLHLYTGLLLLPWVIFFGFSGVLFNHVSWTGANTVTELGRGEMDRLYQWQAADPSQLADDLLGKLNENAAEARYEKVLQSVPLLEGGITFQGTTENGDVSVALSPGTGRATITQSEKQDETNRPDFDGKTMPLDSISEKEGRVIAGRILEAAGIVPLGELKRAERGGTELRFQIVSVEGGKKWNVVYNLAAGKLAGRAADRPGKFDLGTALGRLHKLHGYPENGGLRWFWSAFGDATGVTMVFWGLSGLIMWWQMKPTRVLGICGISLAAVAALFVFGGTYNFLFFGPSPQKGRPTRPAGPSTRPQVGPSETDPTKEAPRDLPGEPWIKTGWINLDLRTFQWERPPLQAIS